MKILIVEDEPKAGDYLRQGLREAGYAVDLVTNGVDGLHHGLQGDHDLLILDVMLPGMDGIEGLSKLKEAAPDSEVIVMSGYSAREKALDAVRLGAYDFFAKPFSLAEMEVVIRRALERRTLLMELRQL